MLYPRREPPDSDASEIPDPETPVYGGLSDPDEMQIQAPGTFQSVKPHEIVALLNFVEESIGKQVRPGRASVAKQLRDWVDEWINSGRDAHGVETPATRNYEKAQTVERAVEDYSLGSRMCLMGFGQALYLSFDLFGQTEESVAGKFTLAPAIKTIAGEKLVLILLSDLRFKLARCPPGMWEVLHPEALEADLQERHFLQRMPAAAQSQQRPPRDRQRAGKSGRRTAPSGGKTIQKPDPCGSWVAQGPQIESAHHQVSQ